jgi:hypothetical protein
MKIYRKTLVVLSALAISGTLAFGSAAMQKDESQAPAKGSQKAPAAESAGKTQSVRGSIVSIDPDSVTLRKADGTQITLALEKATQRAGNLSVGTNVAANYRDVNGKHVASSIKEGATTGKSTKGDTTRSKPTTPPKY